MTRIPGVGRSSASPPLENKEEHERDVALSREDRDRWGTKLTGGKGNGRILRPRGREERMVRAAGKEALTLQRSDVRRRPFLQLPSLGRAGVPSPVLHSASWENHRCLEGH